MARLLRFHPEALLEIEDVASERGGPFADVAWGAFEQISHLPYAFPEWPGRFDVRRRVLRTWPYSVVYTVDAESVLIVALAHHKRRPGYWLSRL